MWFYPSINVYLGLDSLLFQVKYLIYTQLLYNGNKRSGIEQKLGEHCKKIPT